MLRITRRFLPPRSTCFVTGVTRPFSSGVTRPFGTGATRPFVSEVTRSFSTEVPNEKVPLMQCEMSQKNGTYQFSIDAPNQVVQQLGEKYLKEKVTQTHVTTLEKKTDLISTIAWGILLLPSAFALSLFVCIFFLNASLDIIKTGRF